MVFPPFFSFLILCICFFLDCPLLCSISWCYLKEFTLFYFITKWYYVLYNFTMIIHKHSSQHLNVKTKTKTKCVFFKAFLRSLLYPTLNVPLWNTDFEIDSSTPYFYLYSVYTEHCFFVIYLLFIYSLIYFCCFLAILGYITMSFN